MFYMVRYAVQVGKKIMYYNSLFIHLSYASALKEAESKKFYSKYPVVDFYVDTLILNEEV